MWYLDELNIDGMQFEAIMVAIEELCHQFGT